MCLPAEFKEIRKEWKLRKKEEEQARKDSEGSRAPTSATESHAEGVPSQGSYASRAPVQLPPLAGPIGYQPGAQVPNQYQQSPAPASSVQQLQSYGNTQANVDHYGGYPASPYGSSNHMYNHSCHYPLTFPD